MKPISLSRTRRVGEIGISHGFSSAREVQSLSPPPSLFLAYWATSAQGGVTRRGVVLTYLLSIVIGSQ